MKKVSAIGQPLSIGESTMEEGTCKLEEKEIIMSVQKLRIKKGFSYTSVSNKVIQNLKNYEALGLYTYLLSLPNDWVFYKKHLAEHAHLGRDKINKLLQILATHNLIEYAQVRNEEGRFAQLDLHVKDGSDFKIIDLKECAPFTEKPLTVNRLLVNTHYKENNNKININKIFCASKNAHDGFNEFWEAYPRKKDKQVAEKAWVKNGLSKKVGEILLALENQKANDAQWKDSKFVPYPATYLNGKRWEDEIEQKVTKKEEKKQNEAKSTVKAWERGNPDFDRLHGYDVKTRENPLNLTVVSSRK